jgi:putative membrane protein
MALVFLGTASLIHVYIFAMESLLWGRPRINKTFAMTPEMAAQNRLFAFNQGFYNLFLALGAAAGIGLELCGLHSVGLALMVFCGLSMVGAALVLVFSSPKLMKAALVQGVPPLLGLAALLLH